MRGLQKALGTSVELRGEDMGLENSAGKQGGFIGQEFVFGGKLRLNRQVACQEVVRREQQYAAQHFRVLTHVRTTFYDVLLAQRRVELTERLVNIAGEGTKAADQLLRAKEATPSQPALGRCARGLAGQRGRPRCCV